MLRKATRAVARVYDNALAPAGLTTAQFALLRSVDRAGEAALSRLAETLVMDRTSLYRALAPLEARGWVTVAPGHGKTRIATLTDAGRAAMAGAQADWNAVQGQIVGSMGSDAWRQL